VERCGADEGKNGKNNNSNKNTELRIETATQHFDKPTKVIINHEKIANLEFSFEECLEILQENMKGGLLDYNQDNVEILLRGILVSPHSNQYPHPQIWDLFKGIRRRLSVEGDCVASWASEEARGIKANRGYIRPGIILGVYGGMETKAVGPYVLDVSVTGHRSLLVDGDPSYGEVTLLGRINEDIHVNRKNVEFDVAGITYTEDGIRDGEELLTTYGDKYRWGHVVQIGYDRLKKHLLQECSSMVIELPEDVRDLRASNPLHSWVKALVWGETGGVGHHSTRDEGTHMDSSKG